MRLIDADVFEVVCFQGKSDEFLEGAKYILEMIDAQPTAYDISKVVAELEKEKCTRVTYKDKYGQGWNNGTANAIDIVRKGGVE